MIVAKTQLFVSKKSNSSEEQTLIQRALTIQSQMDVLKSDKKSKMKQQHAKCKQAIARFEEGDKVRIQNLGVGVIEKKNRVKVIVDVGGKKFSVRASALQEV